MDLTARRPGPDVVRAIAMLGVVVMNYHGYLVIRGADRGDGWLDDLFDPWTGPLSTRFAATFVLTAGVGVTLMTASSRGDAVRQPAMRWRLVRRGLLLYAFGLAFDFVWDGTILPYYGAMFVLAAWLFTIRTRWLLVVGAAAALAGWGLHWMVYERRLNDQTTDWLTDPGDRSPVGLVIDVFVNGTHPLLPWLAFLCAGMVVGRLLDAPWWRPVAIGSGLTMYALATIVANASTSERAVQVLSDDPFSRSIVYVASALGTALVAFAGITWLADRYAHTRVVDALRRAGQLSLTIYVAHALLFNLLVDWLEVVGPAGLGTALTFAFAYWIVALSAAIWYQRRHGRGPVERLYRHLTN